jgi:hypothetical protein
LKEKNLFSGKMLTNTVSLGGIFSGFMGLIFVAFSRFERNYNRISPPSTVFVRTTKEIKDRNNVVGDDGDDSERKF